MKQIIEEFKKYIEENNNSFYAVKGNEKTSLDIIFYDKDSMEIKYGKHPLHGSCLAFDYEITGIKATPKNLIMVIDLYEIKWLDHLKQYIIENFPLFKEGDTIMDGITKIVFKITGYEDKGYTAQNLYINGIGSHSKLPYKYQDKFVKIG